MGKGLNDFPEFVDVSASVGRVQAELQKVKQRKSEVEQQLVSLKLPAEKVSEWAQFTGGASEAFATEGKLHDEFIELEQQEHFLTKALNQGRAQLDTVPSQVSVEICQTVRPRFLELAAEILKSLKTISECNDKLWELQKTLEDRGVKTGSLPTLIFPLGKWDENGGRIHGYRTYVAELEREGR